MSFSDDGWGLEEPEVNVAVEQLKVESAPAAEKHNVQFMSKQNSRTEIPEKAFIKMETIEEHLPEVAEPPLVEPPLVKDHNATVCINREPPKGKSSTADDGSDDGWGSPQKGDGFRPKIVSRLPVKALSQPTPAFVDDTFDIDSPRALSPVSGTDNRPLSQPNATANEVEHKNAASSGKSLGTEQQFRSDGFGTQQESVASTHPQESSANVAKSFGGIKQSGAVDFGEHPKTNIFSNTHQEDAVPIPNTFGAQKPFGSYGFGTHPKTPATPVQSEDSTQIMKSSQKPNDSFVQVSTPANDSFGFGQNKTDELKENVTKAGGFFGAQKQSSQESQKTSGFGGDSLKPSGFGGSFGGPKAGGFGSVQTSGFGSGNTPSFGSIKPSGLGETKTDSVQEKLSRTDNNIESRSVQNSTSNFGKNPSSFTKSDSTVETTKQFGFGNNAKSTGFGNETKSSGFRNETKSTGFGNEPTSTSFGNQANSTGFGNQAKSTGFGGLTSSVNREFKAEANNLDPEHYSDGKTTGLEKSQTAKSSNFGLASKQTIGEAGTNNSGGFGKSVRFGEESNTSKAVSFEDDSTNKSGGFKTQGSNFGHGSHASFGGASLKKPGFGENNTGGSFGGNKAESSGFGFGRGASGEKNSSAIGETSRTGFGGNSNSGFGGKRMSGFGEQSDSGFGSTGFSNLQTEKSAFGSFGQFKQNGGFGGDNSAHDGGWGNETHTDVGDQPRACFNCKEEGHSSRECPKPKACRNCNELGHISKDCDKPKVPFGQCRNCQKEGHFAKDCTEERVRIEPTDPCRRCNEAGHWSSECPTRPRDLQGNILVPYDVVFTPEEVMFEEAVNNDDRINFDQKVVASMGDNEIPDIATFDGFKNLPQNLHDNLKRMKMNRPTPIQKAAFFPILNGANVVACAHTGSGKTLAFLLPLVMNLLEEREKNPGVTDEKPSPRLLVVAPTRELANQTFNTARQLTYQTGLKCGLAYGGYSRSANLQHLRSFDQLGILVSTIGRLQDFLESGDISLDKMLVVVLDEADRMVDCEDFGEEVCKIIGPPEERTQQTILFSASFSETLQAGDLPKIVKEGYTMLQVDKFGTANENIDQQFLPVPRTEKRTELYKLLGFDDNTMSVLPDARIEKEKTLIFVNSVKFCDTLASNIANCGVSCISMHSHQNQEQRDRTLEDFRHGKYKCMVASNVCARGLNIAGLDHVINYDMPDKKGFDEYVNRIGRTARAGFLGASTAFIDEESDREIIPSLVEVLTEAKKHVPDWLLNINNQEEEAPDGEEEEQW